MNHFNQESFGKESQRKPSSRLDVVYVAVAQRRIFYEFFCKFSTRGFTMKVLLYEHFYYSCENNIHFISLVRLTVKERPLYVP
jgi:hypothetical protein